MKIPIPFFVLSVLLFTGCVSQYKVVVDFSHDLQRHFGEFPTIEVDIAAVTDSEANEVRQMGVEQYFTPNSGIRERLQAQTVFFKLEERGSFVLPSRAPVWQTWQQKDPSEIMVIASLPHDPSMTPQADPRFLFVRMARSYVFARTINILVEPRSIKRLERSGFRRNQDRSQAVQQWVEPR